MTPTTEGTPGDPPPESVLLILEDGTELVDPDDEQIDGLLGFLAGPGNHWARLEAPSGTLTTTRDAGYRFALQWAPADGEGEPLRTVSETLALESVQGAFRACSRGEEAWQAEHLWQPDFRAQLVAPTSPHRARLENSVQTLTLQIVQEAGELPARVPWARMEELAAKTARRVSRELAEEEDRFRRYRTQLEDDVHQALLELLEEAIEKGGLADAMEELEGEEG